MSSKLVFTSFLVGLSVAACSTGKTTTSGPSGTGTTASPTNPPDDDDDAGAVADAAPGDAGKVGPACKEYIACCQTLVAKYPQLAASCDSMKTQIENAQKQGASTATYESACKSGIATLKSAGHCS